MKTAGEKKQPYTEGSSAAETPVLVMTEEGLSLQGNGQDICGDFSKLLPRIRQSNLQGELLVRAARIRKPDHPLRALDATAGLGEDSFLLAAAGFQVDLYELDPVIAALLKDALRRAKEDPRLSEIAERMVLHEGDSIEAMKTLDPVYDVVFLDPMFPAREKSALVKKKFQLLHGLEKPCEDEEALFSAALKLRPKKLVVKRPVKGAFLAGRKPDYSLKGKAVRYDCFVDA